MDPTEAAEKIQDAGEGMSGAEKFRAQCALVISILAMLLAVTSLGGGNVTEEMIQANIHASDTWAFYQAKNVRQTAYRLAADDLEVTLAARGRELPPEARRLLEEKLAEYRTTIERYESEPDPADPANPLKGEGKKQLRAQAETWARQRDRAQERDPNFDYAEVLFQIAIVLGSVAILATSRPVLLLALAFGGAASLLLANGHLLLFNLPF